MMGRLPWLRALIVASTCVACVGYVLHVSSTEQEAVVFPSTVTFAPTVVGQMTTRSITISPASGSQMDTVMSIVEQGAGCPDFSISAAGLPAIVSSVCSGSGASGTAATCTMFTVRSYTFTATFTPSFAGNQNCKLIATISGVANQIDLVGTGTPPPIDIELDTGQVADDLKRCTTCALDFGQANVGSDSPPQFVRVVNEGSGNALIKNVTLGGPNLDRFKIVSGKTADRVLTSKDSETYSITCNPHADKVVENATLTIDSDDPRGARTVALKCEGIQSELDIVSGGVLGLHPRVGEPATGSASLKNSGGAVLTISSLAFHGATIADPPPAGLSTTLQVGDTIAANGAQTKVIDVTFSPAAAAETTPVARLVIGFLNDTETREIVITGPAVDTTLSMTPALPGATASLGTMCVGQQHTTPFELIANGNADFKLERLEVAGDYTVVPRSPVALPTAGAPDILEANGATKVDFDVVTTPMAPGIVAGSLVLHTDIPTKRDQSPVVLLGTALVSGASVAPAAPLEFGTVMVGRMSDEPGKITLTNCDTNELAVTRAEIVGNTEFLLMGDPVTTVAPNSTVEFPIVLAPQFGGVKLATFQVEFSTGTADVPLIGNGDGPLEDTSDPRDTYYACSTGGATGGLPVLAILLLVRRRRR